MPELQVPPPGRLVDIGGRRLYAQVMGEGSPAVVLEAGFLCTALLWARVAPALARFTRVVAYDRAGYGWSDPGPAPRTARAAVADLRALLQAVGVDGPAVLAGHSYGGLVARLYTGLHAADVAGLVLFDPTDPEQFARLRVNVKAQTRMVVALPVLAKVGLLRLLSYLPGVPLLGAVGDLPPRERALVRSLLRLPAQFDTALAEWQALPESLRQVRSAPLPRNLALTVVSAGDSARPLPGGLTPAEFRRGMHQLHAELVARVPGGQHLIAAGLDHARLPGVSPEGARFAVRVLRTMVEEIRGGR
ncbi:MAG TPA: alpha/beta hydrolase [Symbiobacteriaceae bacterium]|nr:alpha/beta hydrolase [Symbiobacteriaceae bacterium]